MKTIILAAGIAKRLQPLTNKITKCLLEIDGETILSKTIKTCINNGLKDIVVLTGHGHKFTEEEIKDIVLKNKIDDLKIKTIYNPEYATKNNCYSLDLAVKDLNEDVIVINSDDVYDEKILAKLKPIPSSALVIDNVKTLTEESMKIYYTNSKVTDINKKLDINKSYGESIGIAKIAKEDMNCLKECLDEVVRTDSDLYYEDAFQLMFDKVDFEVCDTDGLKWTEVDTLEDFRIAEILVEANFKS